MKQICFAMILCLASIHEAMAWGQEGHSIVAEIAQRQVKPSTRAEIDKLLHHGTLASVASWADDIKFTERPETKPWHFVDIPLKNNTYTAADCVDETTHTPDDCLVSALKQLKSQLVCGKTEKDRLDALKFVVHFVGDSTQPLHTVKDKVGGNGVMVKVKFCGLKEPHCTIPSDPRPVNFHEIWDSGLINATFFDWGAYVGRLLANDGWLNSAEARDPKITDGESIGWVNDTHAEAQIVWTKMLPADNVLEQKYYDDALPILDRQLGAGGLRLARYLDEAFAEKDCATK